MSHCDRHFDNAQAAVSEGTVSGTELRDIGLARVIVLFWLALVDTKDVSYLIEVSMPCNAEQ